MESEEKTAAAEDPSESHDMSGHEHMNMIMGGESHHMGGHDHSQMKMDEAGHDTSTYEHSGMHVHGGQQKMSDENGISNEHHHHGMMNSDERAGDHLEHTGHNSLSPMDYNMIDHDMSAATPANTRMDPPPKLLKVLGMNHMEGHDMSAATPANTRIEAPHPKRNLDMSAMDHSTMNHRAIHNMHLPSATQPMFPTVTIAVCHCGAGCLLGDIVGEWLVFGTNATLGHKSIGPEFLIGTFPLQTSPFPLLFTPIPNNPSL